MPYNLSIPGQVSEFQLRAIEAVASLVPGGGTVVEIGSLFGRSSYAWGASVPPSATVHCIDPWEGNAGVRPMEQRHGIAYGVEAFRIHTNDLSNVVPHQGYSPRDFLSWKQAVDLFYEDSVHRDPILTENLKFWSSHLKPTGVASGDDYRPRFPDVVNGVHALAKRLGRELIVVDKFWCLLPPTDLVPAAAAVRERLLAIRAEAHEAAIAQPFAHGFAIQKKPSAVSAGESLSIEVYACNESPRVWLDAAGSPLEGHVSIRIEPKPEGTPVAALLPLRGALEPDLPVVASVNVSTQGLPVGLGSVTAQFILTDAAGSLQRLMATSLNWDLEIRPPEANSVSLPRAYQVFWEKTPDDYESIDSVDVHAAYRMLLGRPPEGGEDGIRRHIESSGSLSSLRRRFMSSPEFLKANFRILAPEIIGRSHVAAKNKIEIEVPSYKLARLFDHIQKVWSRLGDDEPHYSVLSSPKFKSINLGTSERDFYESGSAEVDGVLRRLQDLGISPDRSGRAMEFGCGVGRVTRFLANVFDALTAYDISRPHLAYARRYLDQEKITNTTLKWVENPESLDIPEHGFFYSRIVFQHNPPPMTKHFLAQIMEQLSPRGIAVFQIITAIQGYAFHTDRYLDEMEGLDGPELHAFPLQDIFASMADHGVFPVDVSRDSSVTGFDKVSTMIIAQKR